MEDICSICLISPIPPLNVCVTNCSHRFCKTCLETWQNRINRDCPICREDITYYMYNNSQIRPVFRYVHNDNNIQTSKNHYPSQIFLCNIRVLVIRPEKIS